MLISVIKSCVCTNSSKKLVTRCAIERFISGVTFVDGFELNEVACAEFSASFTGRQ